MLAASSTEEEREHRTKFTLALGSQTNSVNSSRSCPTLLSSDTPKESARPASPRTLRFSSFLCGSVPLWQKEDRKRVRAPESDHPAKLGVPGATNAFPRSVEGKARKATGIALLLLQFRQAPRRSEVRTRDPDSGDAGWARQAAPDAQGDLRVRPDIRININRVRRDRVCRHT